MISNKRLTALFVSAATLGVAAVAWACGSYYSGSLLDSGDGALTAKPVTRFASSVADMTPKTGWRAESSAQATRETESATAGITLLHKKLFLGEKLTQQQGFEAMLLLREYAQARAALLNASPAEEKNLTNAAGKRVQLFDPILQEIGTANFAVNWLRVNTSPEALMISRSRLSKIIPEGITFPEEFARYLAGAAEYRQNNIPAAVEAWKKVVALPVKERSNQSVFAAYMLGVTTMNGAAAAKDPATALREARDFFRMTRRFCIEGSADPCGLGAASLGMEAKTYLSATGADSAGSLAQAATLYLEQNAAGDSTALASIQQTVRRALTLSGEELSAAAKNPVLRPLVTAYITAEGGPFGEVPSSDAARAWIQALENGGVVEKSDAAKLAFLCYQQGEYVSCMRWLQKSSSKDPLAGWLMARLLLREGRTTESANLLARIVRDQSLKTKIATPGETSGTGDFSPVAPWRYEPDLVISESGNDLASRILAEHAVLSLSLKRYAEALDSFLRCGLDDDAAYIAEYVMTSKELQNYVDALWPDAGEKTGEIGTHIRHILAKRFMRERRWQDARPYFPQTALEVYDRYVVDVQQAYNTALNADNRAAGFWLAAANVRDNGKALFAAEAGPTWSVNGGWREHAVPQQSRTGSDSLAPISRDEAVRVASRTISKEDRDHRYRAAELASYAAALLPNDDERTSRILATAGVWLKNRDPRAAEPFYKMLAIRCADTPIGKLANTLHWFPPEVTGTIVGVWDKAPRVQKSATNDAAPATPEKSESDKPLKVTEIQITPPLPETPVTIHKVKPAEPATPAAETGVEAEQPELAATPVVKSSGNVNLTTAGESTTAKPVKEIIEKTTPPKPSVKTPAPEVKPLPKPEQKPSTQPPAPATTTPKIEPEKTPEKEPLFDPEKSVIAPATVIRIEEKPATSGNKPKPADNDIWK